MHLSQIDQNKLEESLEFTFSSAKKQIEECEVILINSQSDDDLKLKALEKLSEQVKLVCGIVANAERFEISPLLVGEDGVKDSAITIKDINAGLVAIKTKYKNPQIFIDHSDKFINAILVRAATYLEIGQKMPNNVTFEAVEKIVQSIFKQLDDQLSANDLGDFCIKSKIGKIYPDFEKNLKNGVAYEREAAKGVEEKKIDFVKPKLDAKIYAGFLVGALKEVVREFGEIKEKREDIRELLTEVQLQTLGFKSQELKKIEQKKFDELNRQKQEQERKEEELLREKLEEERRRREVIEELERQELERLEQENLVEQDKQKKQVEEQERKRVNLRKEAQIIRKDLGEIRSTLNSLQLKIYDYARSPFHKLFHKLFKTESYKIYTALQDGKSDSVRSILNRLRDKTDSTRNIGSISMGVENDLDNASLLNELREETEKISSWVKEKQNKVVSAVSSSQDKMPMP